MLTFPFRIVNVELHSHRLKLLILQKSPKLRNSNAAVQDDLTNVQMPPSVIKPVHHHDDHPACKSSFQSSKLYGPNSTWSSKEI